MSNVIIYSHLINICLLYTYQIQIIVSFFLLWVNIIHYFINFNVFTKFKSFYLSISFRLFENHLRPFGITKSLWKSLKPFSLKLLINKNCLYLALDHRGSLHNLLVFILASHFLLISQLYFKLRCYGLKSIGLL